jgi:hypothetical protein
MQGLWLKKTGSVSLEYVEDLFGSRTTQMVVDRLPQQNGQCRTGSWKTHNIPSWYPTCSSAEPVYFQHRSITEDDPRSVCNYEQEELTNTFSWMHLHTLFS